ncbi:MAG: dTDP-4-dehydrorhamnose 3,5-epimerase [Blautia sp.]|nr:dTDP-4-dehydrorhamnose 3,5-epimerase [Lachnoclostridium sp.]MCM1212184.1 dTDP-4-dehydrorhamnose 3,5-epimerase [Blautia sp.]
MNTSFQIYDLPMKDVKLITPFYVEDNRGFFLKSMEKDVFREWGLETEIYEDFESYSRKGVIRGLHFQTKNPQIKIVRAIKGTIHDVIVDLRKGSETFGKHLDVMLSDENHNSLWIPGGFAHGFEVLSEDAIMSYKCLGKYLSGYDTGIRWNDEELAINWKTEEPVISEKDIALMTFKEFRTEFSGL